MEKSSSARGGGVDAHTRIKFVKETIEQITTVENAVQHYVDLTKRLGIPPDVDDAIEQIKSVQKKIRALRQFTNELQEALQKVEGVNE